MSKNYLVVGLGLLEAVFANKATKQDDKVSLKFLNRW